MSRTREHNEQDCNNFYQEPGWEEGGWCLNCGNDVPETPNSEGVAK